MRRIWITVIAASAGLATQAAAQQPAPAAPAARPAVASAPAAEFEEEARRIVVRIEGRPVQLDTLVVKRKGAQGPLPVALITHGKPPDRVSMGDMRPDRLRPQARDMARRGWMAVAVMRRGFGQSDGPPAPDMSCAQLTLTQRFQRDAQDLAGVLAEVLKRPDAQQSAIAMGVSAGGAAVLALAAMQPPGLKAVVNISGGLRVEQCTERSENALVDTVRAFGPRTTIPALWIYADNDSFFSPKLVDRMYEAALETKMDVRRVTLPAMGNDGHDIFSNAPGRRAWLVELDQSLGGWRLPTWPRSLIDDIAQAMKIDPRRNRATLERYIAAPGDKSLAFSPSTGRMFFRFGGGSLKAVEDGALKDCTDAGLKDCRVAARDNNPT